MALNISIFWLGWPIFLAALIVIVALIIVLTIIERKIHKRVEDKKTFEQTYYQRRLGAIKSLKNNEQILKSIDEVAKEFFEEKYRPKDAPVKKKPVDDKEQIIESNDKEKKPELKEPPKMEPIVSKNSSYTDLIDIFKKKGDNKAVEFSDAMVKVLYSGQKVSRIKLDSLYKMLEEIIGQKPIVMSEMSPVKSAQTIAKPPVKKQIVETEPVEKIEVLGPSKETRIVGNVQNKIPVEKRGFFSRIFGKRPVMTKEQKTAVESPLMKAPKKVNMDLVKYIEEGLRRGFDIGLLKDKLVGAGFSKNDVEIAAGFVGERKSKRTSLVVKNNLVGKPVEKISKSPNKLEEKHRGILERFFHPKNPELAKIKDEVENGGQEDKKDSVKELIAPVKEHGNIESMDDLNRVRRRIEQKQKDLARKGYKGAELTRVD